MTSAMYETDRILLGPFNRKHLDGPYKNWFHDQEVTKWNSHGLFPYTKTQMEAFMAGIESGSRIVWAVMARPTPKGKNYDPVHIGNVSLQSINWVNRSAEYAVVVGDKDAWSKGYATEASRILFDHTFKKLGLHRIWSGTAKPNVGMRKVFEKLGMEKEGTFREATFLHGKWEDVVCYGITQNEWNRIADINSITCYC